MKNSSIYTERLSVAFFKVLLEKYVYTDVDLKMCDIPDLQAEDNTVGIEVTKICNESEQKLTGDFNKYHMKKKDEIPSKILNHLGIDYVEFDNENRFYKYTPIEEKYEIKYEQQIISKIHKLEHYKKFEKNALLLDVIDYNGNTKPEMLLETLKNNQKNAPVKYDYLFVWDMFHLHCFNIESNKYQKYTPTSKELDDMNDKAKSIRKN